MRSEKKGHKNYYKEVRWLNSFSQMNLVFRPSKDIESRSLSVAFRILWRCLRKPLEKAIEEGRPNEREGELLKKRQLPLLRKKLNFNNFGSAKSGRRRRSKTE